jgi:hypothetical protein
VTFRGQPAFPLGNNERSLKDFAVDLKDLILEVSPRYHPYQSLISEPSFDLRTAYSALATASFTWCANPRLTARCTCSSSYLDGPPSGGELIPGKDRYCSELL